MRVRGMSTLLDNEITVTDLFAGAGGSSTGATTIPGVRIRYAANHWQTACDVHNLNHPDTDHAAVDLHQEDPRFFATTMILWASPECTKWSQANGSKPLPAIEEGLFEDPLSDDAAQRSRLLMFEVECRRHDVDPLTSRLPRGQVAPVIDPFVLDKAADPYRKGGRKLLDVCGVYGVRHVGAHDASGDALAAGRLWTRILLGHPDRFGGLESLGALHLAQVRWRGEQMRSLRAYFDRTGKPHDGCDPGWPLQSRVAAAGAVA